MKGTVIYPEPRVMHFREKKFPHRINEDVCYGETSRSWLCGTSCRPKEYLRSKAEWEPAAEREFIEAQWVEKHGQKIAKRIYDWYARVDYATLRKIADLIGYEGK